MKNKFRIIVTIITLICTSGASYAQFEKSYYTKEKNKIVPQTAFNAQKAASDLTPGNATVTGIVQLKARNRSNTHIKQQIYLFPASDYLEELLSLQKKHRKKEIQASPEFLQYKKTAVIKDEDGSFVFTNLKPGKYVLYTELYLLGSKSGAYRVGNQNWGLYNGMGYRVGGYSTPVYETKSWMTSKLYKFSKEVEITQDREKVQTEL